MMEFKNQLGINAHMSFQTKRQRSEETLSTSKKRQASLVRKPTCSISKLISSPANLVFWCMVLGIPHLRFGMTGVRRSRRIGSCTYPEYFLKSHNSVDDEGLCFQCKADAESISLLPAGFVYQPDG